ncbi:hypothetical protein DITRI_Ditri03aG0186100 [Diplodiscus trichospermus]
MDDGGSVCENESFNIIWDRRVWVGRREEFKVGGDDGREGESVGRDSEGESIAGDEVVRGGNLVDCGYALCKGGDAVKHGAVKHE